MSESIDEEIRALRALYWSAQDPDGRGFAPLADAYRRKGELDEAQALTRDGLSRLPDFAAGHLVAARVARDRGDLLDAREHLDRALSMEPQNVTALTERAEIRWDTGDREGALADLREACDLDPERDDVRRRLQELEEGGGITSSADTHVHDMDDTIELDTLDPTGDSGDAAWPVYTRTMGEIYARQGLNDHALEVFEHLAAASPEDAELSLRLQEVRARLERSTTADALPVDVSGASATGSPRSIGRYLQDILAWVPGAVPIESLAPDDVAGTEEEIAVDDTTSQDSDDEFDDFQSWLESVRP